MNNLLQAPEVNVREPKNDGFNFENDDLNSDYSGIVPLLLPCSRYKISHIS